MGETEELQEKELIMSNGLLGSLFSRRNTQSLPVSMSIGAPLEILVDAEADRSFEYALDALPCNAMFCDRELVLRYLNRASRKALLTLQQYLPVPVDKIVGKSIHIFHKSPANIDRILGAKQHQGIHQLPHKATIPLGPLKLYIEAEPMIDQRGEFIGTVVLWCVSTQGKIEALRAAQEAQRNDIELLK